ncbi:MAG: integrase, partial [Oceanicola sp.]|nr:integrase [Oceanicola sp.]
MERLRTVAKEYQELKGVDPQTSDHAVSRLIAVAGNLPVDQYTRQHAKEFLDSYRKQKTST